jgi:SIR2-like domain
VHRYFHASYIRTVDKAVSSIHTGKCSTQEQATEMLTTCTIHNPDQYMADLRQILAQGRKRLGIFIGAGGPADVCLDKKTGKISSVGEPLIPTIDKLTEKVLTVLDEQYSESMNCIKSNIGEPNPNIEAILSRVRSLAAVLGKNIVCKLDGAGYKKLAEDICNAIGEIVKVPLPSEPNPFLEFAAWVGGAPRDNPVEIFTTNYDLLLEESFERTNLPYFDGFVGAHRAFFDPASVANNDLPARWTRIWKLHGSLGWEINSRQEVIRTGSRNATHLIYPDHLKYDQTQKLPYSALLDRLRRFLSSSDTLLITTGFSFYDAHISACISGCLSANPSASVFAFQHKKLESESAARKLAQQRTNLSVYAPDGAVINGISGMWRPGELPAQNWESIRATFWGRQISDDSSSPMEFLLGRFGTLARFFALSKASDLGLSPPSQTLSK